MDTVTLHYPEAESAVLGAMLFSRKAIIEASSLLTADDFYDGKNAIIFDSILKLHAEQPPVDLLTLPESLAKSQTLDAAGGNMYLADLASASATGANIRHHANLVFQKSQLRKLRDVGLQLGEDVTGGEDAETIAHRHSSALLDISLSQSADDGIAFSQVHGEVMEAYEERAARARKGIPYAGMDCGFDALNKRLNGLCEHELTVIAARTSMGKTTLALEIAVHVALTGRPVVIFTLEMPRRQIGDWIERLVADLDPERFRTGTLPDEEYQRWQQGSQPLLPITIFDSRNSIPEIREHMQRITQSDPASLWVIDYLQLIRGPGKKSKYEDVSYIADELKAMSKEFPGHLLALAQLNRAADSREDRRPHMADLRDSGNIEQSADNVGLIYRPGFYEDLVIAEQKKADGDVSALLRFAEIFITKCKNGPTGTAKLCWVPDRAYFTDAETAL